ncbi:MAG: hypothetical protein ACKVJG_05180 [Candidatus Latescibacterota bacterium]
MLSLIVIAMVLASVLYYPAAAQQTTTAPAAIGFVDADHDGRNDRFSDSDGNGINDVDRQPYSHHFSFADENDDGINDHFRDSDGDGVNDWNGRYLDADDNGFIDNVIDADGDHHNDITGEKYDRRGLRGWRYGFFFEERGHRLKRFVDHNGDGMHDALERLHKRFELSERKMDFFLDEDGDGIDDGRMLRGRPAPFVHPFLDKKRPLCAAPCRRVEEATMAPPSANIREGENETILCGSLRTASIDADTSPSHTERQSIFHLHRQFVLQQQSPSRLDQSGLCRPRLCL